MHDRNPTLRGLAALGLLAAVLGFALPAAAAEKGWFGLSVNIEADEQSENPMVHTVTIVKVAPNSPAAQAGLASGDLILEADGTPLPGLKTDALRAAMGKQVGETLRLKIRRGGTVRVVSMVAAAAPPDA